MTFISADGQKVINRYRHVLRLTLGVLALSLVVVAIQAIMLTRANHRLDRSIPLVMADEFKVGQPVAIDRFFTADLRLPAGKKMVTQETYFILLHDQRAPRRGYNGMAFAVVPTSAASFSMESDVPVGTMVMQPVIGEGNMGIRALLHPRRVESRDPPVPKLSLTSVSATR